MKLSDFRPSLIVRAFEDGVADTVMLIGTIGKEMASYVRERRRKRRIERFRHDAELAGIVPKRGQNGRYMRT